jgi:dolichol-phosphate mannosyltransferase
LPECASEVKASLESCTNTEPRVVLIVPTLNESEGIVPTIGEYVAKVPQLRVLVIDGCSTDGTPDAAGMMAGVHVETVAGGKGIAILKALEVMRVASPPEYVIVTDGDHTYPADTVPRMLNQLEERQDVGMILGDRFHRHKVSDFVSDIYVFGNALLRVLHRMINGIRLNDPLSGLRVIRWEAIRDWKPKSKGFDVEAEMNIYLRANGWKIEECPIDYRPRMGRKKLRVRHGATILVRMLRGA